MFAPGAGRWLGPVVALLILLAALAFATPLPRLPLLGGLVALAAIVAFLAVFFRDPDRVPGEGVVSAADGRIRAVDREGDRWRISVFMNVTNVHVNRAPIDGRVESTESAGEGYRAAFRPDADRNVRHHYHFATSIGPVEVVQITGLVARRLVPFVGEGSVLRKGDRLGMIVLGSRVDVLLPADRVAPVVQVGDRVAAGLSTIARVLP